MQKPLSYSAGILSIILFLISGCAPEVERAMRTELEDQAQALRVEDFTGTRPRPAELPENPTLDDYLRVAAINNPGLRAAFYEWKAAMERVPQVRALPDPKFSYTRYIEEVETRVGAQKNRFMLMQMVPWPGKLVSKSDMAVRSAMAKKYLFDAKKLALFYRVSKAYLEYYFLSRSIKVVGSNLDFITNLEKTLETRFKAGVARNASLIQIQVEQGKLEDRLKSLQALQGALAARLNSAIGRDPMQALPWPVELAVTSPVLKEEEIAAVLRENNPDLEAARQRVRASEAGMRLARSQYLPDFGVGAAFVDTERRDDMNPDDNGKDPVMLTLEMSLPVWWNKYRAGVREARARHDAAQSKVVSMSNDLTADLRLAFFNYQDAKRKYTLFHDTLVPKAEQGLAAAQTAFSAGKAAFTDLIDAERTLLELRLMAERAVVDRGIRLAELEKLAGRSLRAAAEQNGNIK